MKRLKLTSKRGYSCPPCFFRRTYQKPNRSSFLCAVCCVGSSTKICLNCSEDGQICHDCCGFIRDGNSYSLLLEQIEDHLHYLIQIENQYHAVLLNLKARNQLYSNASQERMLSLCCDL